MATRRPNAIALAMANYVKTVEQMPDPFTKVESNEKSRAPCGEDHMPDVRYVRFSTCNCQTPMLDSSHRKKQERKWQVMDRCQSCNYPLLQEEEHFELGFGEPGPLCNDCEVQ